MYSNEIKMSDLEEIKLNNWPEMSPFSKIITEYLAKGYTQKQISLLQLSKNSKPTGWVSNKIKFGQIPTLEQWQLICNLFKIENKYDSLVNEYEHKRRYFNNPAKLEEVLNFSQESSISKDFDHDTIKPEKLTRALILTCSKPGDLVVVPFAGSGTECSMSIREARKYQGYEIEKKYVNMAKKRCQIEVQKKRQLELI